ncbi:leukocyte receptor cluster (LRC) member 9 [Chelydra serpentina]|uniref:Leukocyte receptor cluster (LRC) member 9 n=1 Tax=Chelydra serpentina TaxID=8475 RepID=A0A8T1SAL2_CHESE|nr:leukocyte receptor cluster (LRC) member 9 [Chelydra serpentina]
MEGRGLSAGGDFAAPLADLAGGALEPGSDGPGVTEPAPAPSPACRFFLAGGCRFGTRCRNPHPGALPGAPSPPPEPPSKKPPMKTAGDVISRILWDPQLPPGAFTVGHLDRFSGVREDAFTAFSWEDLASVGPDVLAIPQHRIQYFKYRGRVVWDKASRLDDVFGSTGGGRTILEVMEEEAGCPQAVGTGDGGSTGGCPPAAVPDGGAAVPEEDEADEDEPGAQRRPPAVPRPTHFVAVRITSPELRGSVARLQEALTRADPGLAEFCAPLPTLHLTLCLLRLAGAGEVQAAVTALRELQAEHRRLLPPAPFLRFRGLGTFRDRVLYAAPAPGPEPAGLAHALERGFACKGLTVVPLPAHACFHLTVAKIPAGGEPRLSRPPEPPGEELGTQAVESLCLCQVGGGRRTDGFYSTLAELDLY